LFRTIIIRLEAHRRRFSELSLSLSCGIAALLWAIHPMRVEPVAWASGISYLVAGFFVLVSLLSYLRAHRIDQVKPDWRWLGFSTAAFLAAIITYPVVMAFPAIIVLLDIFILKRFSALEGGWLGAKARRVWLEKLPYALICAAVLGFTLFRRTHASGFWLPPVTLQTFGIPERMMQAFYVWAYYLWKPFAPVGLAPVSINLLSVAPLDLRFICSLLLVVGVSAFLLIKRKRCGGWLALWLCYLLFLVPVLGLTEHPHYTPDRYSYLVAILFCLPLAVGLARFWHDHRVPRMALTLSMGLAAVLAGASYRQTLVWQNSLTLFDQMLSSIGDHPYKGDIHWRIGAALLQRGNLTGAEYHLQESLRAMPTCFQAHGYLGGVYAQTGRLKEALAEYDAAFAANPRFIGAFVHKGSLLVRMGKMADAVQCYQSALRLDSDRLDALHELAWIRATDPDPQNRDGSEAVRLALRACQAASSQEPILLLTLAAAYAEAGKFELAIKTAEDAAALSSSRGDKESADLTARMLALYRKGEAFRDRAGTASPNQ